MHSIVDSSVKSGCCILSIYNDGYSTLFKHPEGFLLSPSRNTKNELIVLMENRNSHKAIPGLVAVLLTCSPKDFLKGTFVSHEIVLIQGLVFNSNQQLEIVYHKWINEINRTDLYDLLVCDSTNECIIDQLFHQEPCSIAASDVNVMYFNQLSGVSHSSFSRYVSTCSHSSGLDVYQSSLQQDHWCMGRLRRKTIENNYKFLRFTMQPQLRPNVYLGNKKHKNKNAISAGLSRVHQDKNQLVFALYCLQFKSCLFEKYFLQVLPSIRSDDYQDFVPLTKKESGKLDDMCRNGPIPVEQLRNNMIDFANVTFPLGNNCIRKKLQYRLGLSLYFIIELKFNIDRRGLEKK